MKHIEQAIGDLLLRHNCVIVPAFGGFVAEQLSAKIDYDKGVMTPPRKALLFNKQLVSNDGLLINELASRQAVSFEEASKGVAATVSEWNYRLKQGDRIELDRVGILFIDAENNLRFEQDRFFNLLLASFGLDQVHFISQNEVEETQTIEQPSIEPVLVDSEDTLVVIPEQKQAPIKHLPRTETVAAQVKEEVADEKIVPLEAPQKRSRVWKYVAAACFLPIAFYSIWIPTRTDVLESGVLSIKDFNPFYKSAEGIYTQNEYSEDITFDKNTEQTLQEQIDGLEIPTDVFPYSYADNLNVLVDISEINKTEEAAPSEANANPEPTPVDVPETVEQPVVQPDAMNFIVGCFGDKSNAENLVQKLNSEGLSAFIVDVKGGLHRVSAGAALSNEAMNEIRSKSESLGFEGWILK
ncbi:MAG: HU-CCDC81 and SPOR domain-containing protein [Flavobacteriales bacterium]|nr:HU-CCDC81 and SPOR domain-containing protein [Flavobacteriales bacterium]